jgi:uridylate kinase
LKKPVYDRIVLKISGEGFCRPGGFGFDRETLEAIAGEVSDVARTGVQVVVVVGGGNFIRGAELAKVTGIQAATADYMGMLGTVLNALALQDTIEAMGLETRVQSALRIDRVCEMFIGRRCIRHLEKGRIVILAAGTGNPFVTTDTCAAQRAIETKANVLLKATKVDGVYSADPVRQPDAERYEKLNYNEVIDKRLKVMDVSAVDLCQKGRVPIIVFNLMKRGNMLAVVCGERVGTIIDGD